MSRGGLAAAGAAAVGTVVLALGALGLLGSCSVDPVAQDLRDIEAAYERLRDTILRGDDRAFFEMHCKAAQDAALEEFPKIRARYVASPVEEREAFHRLFGVTGDEFLSGTPLELVTKILPVRSGWRARAGMFRTARVKDVRIDRVDLPGGGTERRGVVTLEIENAVDEQGKPVPDRFLPTVILVKDEGGWRRRSFFME